MGHQRACLLLSRMGKLISGFTRAHSGTRCHHMPSHAMHKQTTTAKRKTGMRTRFASAGPRMRCGSHPQDLADSRAYSQTQMKQRLHMWTRVRDRGRPALDCRSPRAPSFVRAHKLSLSLTHSVGLSRARALSLPLPPAPCPPSLR